MRHQIITELFQQHADALVLLARNWCPLPEDAVQAAFIDLAQLAEPPRHPKAWLYKATKRKALNLARSETRRCRHAAASSEGTPKWFEPDEDQAFHRCELQAALQKLNADEREIVVARVWGELGFEEMGEVFDCSTSTIFRRYKSALTKLKEMLE